MAVAAWSLPAKRGSISSSLLAKRGSISWYLLAKSGSSWSLLAKTVSRGLCQPRDSWSLLAKRGSISWSLLAMGGSRLFCSTSWSLPAKSISWSLLAKGGSRLITSWSRPARRLNEADATLRTDTGMDFLSPIIMHVRVNTGLNRSLIDRSQQPFEMSRPFETPHPF